MTRLSVPRVCGLIWALFVALLAPATVYAQSASVPVDSLYDRAERATEAGSTDAALALYGRVLKRDSSELEAFYDRAEVFGMQDRYLKAAQSFKQVQERDPSPPALVFGYRAWYLIMAGEKLETAQDLARRAARRDAGRLDWALHRGHAYLLDQQPRTAKFYYRTAMQRIEGNDDLEQALTDFDILVDLGHPEEILRETKDWFHVTYLREGDDMDDGGTSPLALLGTWITVVVGLVSLFQKGGEAMTDVSQGHVRDWLTRTDRAERLSSWPDSFKSLFDAVFTEKHFSWTCFYRSALASIVVVTVTLLGMLGFQVISLQDLESLSPEDSIILGSIYGLGFLVLINSIIDYLSLYQTRWVIEKMAGTKRVSVHLGFLILDALLTTAIFVYTIGGVQFAVAVLQGAEFERAVWEIMILDIPGMVYGWLSESEPVLRAGFFSTFLTSIWIWLYALAGVTVRSTLSLFRGMDWLNEFFDVENRPVQALGLMLAVLTTAGFLLSVPFLL